MSARAGHGTGGANTRAKNSAMASAMKDNGSRRGRERLTGTCPLCMKLVPREISGCLSAQKGKMVHHILTCKG